MNLKAAQKWERDNMGLIYSSFNKIFKVMSMWSTEKWKYYGRKHFFSSLNVIIENPPYRSMVVLRHYHYRDGPKLGELVVAFRRIPWSCHDCIAQLYLPWDTKFKDTCYQTVYDIYFRRIPRIVFTFINISIIRYITLELRIQNTVW